MNGLPECSQDPTGIHIFDARGPMNDQWSSHLETLSRGLVFALTVRSSRHRVRTRRADE
jgi:hypothetical protein